MTAQEWEEYFRDKTLPAEIVLDNATVIKNPQKCIESHLAVLGKEGNAATFGGFRLRLEGIKRHLEQLG